MHVEPADDESMNDVEFNAVMRKLFQETDSTPMVTPTPSRSEVTDDAVFNNFVTVV